MYTLPESTCTEGLVSKTTSKPSEMTEKSCLSIFLSSHFLFFLTLTFCLVSVHILNHCKNMAVLLSIDDLMVTESVLFHYPFQL